jgi:thiol-disulfide isomerase/thioredoxin
VLLGLAGLGLLGTQVWMSSRLMRQQRELLELLVSNDDVALPVLDGEVASGGSFSPRSAPPFDLPALTGGRLSLKTLLKAGKPVLLLFVDPKCGPCRKLVPDIEEWHRRFSSEFEVVLISRGAVEVNRQKFGDLTVALQDDTEVYDLYGVAGTPTGVLVSPSGMIWDSYAEGRDQVRDLVVRITRGETGPTSRKKAQVDERDPRALLRIPTGPAVGTGGTRLPLPDLDGGFIGLDDLRGDRAVLLFFSPDCEYSQGMLADLREWEEDAGERGRRLLIISDGSKDANRAFGLRSRIVIDDAFTTGHDYGVTGTPVAIALDEEGRVASALAVGADAVLDLLDAEIEAPAELIATAAREA